jgi:PKD repeat protein
MYSYQVEGTYTVKLEVMDAEGDLFNITHEVLVKNVKPETSIISSKTSPDMDEEVTLSAKDTEDTSRDLAMITFRWNIDGRTFYGPSQIKHVFRGSGTKTITVEAFDGTDHSDKETMNLVVNNPPPVIYLDAPSKAAAGEFIILDVSGTLDTITDQPNLTYSFDMGDGSDPVDTMDPVLNYTYEEGGIYKVIITVMDSGSGSSMEHEIEVTEPASTSSEGNNSALVFLILVAVVALIVIGALAVLLVIKKRNEEQQPPIPPNYLPGRPTQMGSNLPGPPPPRPLPPAQPGSARKQLPSAGSSTPPVPKKPN